jgi:hypothetical protein
MDSSSVCLDMFSWCASAHPDNDGAAQDRVRQVPEARQRHCAERGEFFSLDLLSFHHAAACARATSMSRINDSSDFFMLLGARPKDGVNLVMEHRRESVRIRNLAE